MNIANPCKLFLIVSALTAGFALRADGTLPIPLPVSETELPLNLNGNREITTTTAQGLQTKVKLEFGISIEQDRAESVSLGIRQLCDPGLQFYSIDGSAQLSGDDLYELKGICAPQNFNKPGRRQFIAEKPGRILKVDGDFKASESPNQGKIRSFSGNLTELDSVTRLPLSADGVRKTITFSIEN